jgi:PleD family two-component response regulator
MSSGNVEAMEHQVEAEFLEEVRDTLSGLDVLIGNLRSRSAKADEALPRLRHDMVSVATCGRSLDQPLIVIVAHRLSEYLADLKDLSATQIDDIQTFLDQIRKVLDGEVSPAADASAKMVRALPAKKAFDFDVATVTQTNVEILLVIPDKAMNRIVERELAACGYRVSNVRSPFQALETAVRTKPDMVIASAVLEDLSGIDLACAFSSMAPTRNLPFAILTSYSWGHPSLEGLPPRAPIIRKGPQFGEDLAEALSRLHIT